MPLDAGSHVQANAPRVLVADDQADIVTALQLLLREAGLDADAAASVQGVRERLEAQSYDLLLMDLNYARDTTSGREGLELLAEVHGRYPDLPVVVMTGWGTIGTAVEAMRRGARSFVTKPWDNATLADTVQREIADGRATRDVVQFARRDHDDAQQIQRGLLPRTLPALQGLDLAARWQPALAFGGDWYDATPDGSTQVVLSIADVCGKGLAAAIVMADLQAMARAFAAAAAPPREIAGRLNAELARMSGPRRLVTAFCARFDATTRRLAFTNAGHNPPVLVRRDGSVVRLASGGMVLGAFADLSFAQHEVMLTPGDRLILYTDGITEAEGGGGDEFGEARLVQAIVSRRAGDARGLVDGIFADVAAFAPGPLRDDATVLAAAIG